MQSLWREKTDSVEKEKITETKEIVSEKETDEIVKYTIKDSVFTNLFREKKYLLQLYQALHPEDSETTEDDLTDITIENVLTDGQYNDLGFAVGRKLFVLAEAQSTWTMNILVRAFLYLAQSYHEYFKKHNMSLYYKKQVVMPKPELYVIYTGEYTEKQEYLSLSESFFGGEETALEVKVKVLYGDNEKDIIGQYVMFTKIYDEQRKKYGRSREAIMETIRICKDRDVLKEYLESRESEVVNIMMTLFDEETIMKNYEASIREESLQKGLELGKENGILLTKKVFKLSKEGRIISEIAKECEVSEETVRDILE